MPTEAIPTEAIPTEPIPTEAMPTEPMPTEAMPTEAIPTEPIPSVSFPLSEFTAKAIPPNQKLPKRHNKEYLISSKFPFQPPNIPVRLPKMLALSLSL